MRLTLCITLLAFAHTALAAPKSDSTAGQFIDKSIVTYPKSLGQYSLTRDFYDPTQPANGVSLRYELPDAPPDLAFDIFVYPLGRVDTPKAVTDAAVEMEGEIRALEQQKIYSDLKFDAAVPIDVTVPPSSMVKSDDKANATSPVANGPTETSSARPDSGARAIVDAAIASAPPTMTTGRKRALTMTRRGTPSESLAYLFYRNLFLISVRATVPSSTLPSGRFNALVDRAVQDLVPTIDIQNFGKCATIYVDVGDKSADKEKETVAGAVELVRGVNRVLRENCSNEPGPDTAPVTGRDKQTIVYPAGFWK